MHSRRVKLVMPKCRHILERRPHRGQNSRTKPASEEGWLSKSTSDLLPFWALRPSRGMRRPRLYLRSAKMQALELVSLGETQGYRQRKQMENTCV